MVRVNLVEADAWLFDSKMRSKHTDMGEIRASTGILLIWSNISSQGIVWEAIFDVYHMYDSMRPVRRVQILTREHGTYHVGKLAVCPLDYRVLEGGTGAGGL